MKNLRWFLVLLLLTPCPGFAEDELDSFDLQAECEWTAREAHLIDWIIEGREGLENDFETYRNDNRKLLRFVPEEPDVEIFTRQLNERAQAIGVEISVTELPSIQHRNHLETILTVRVAGPSEGIDWFVTYAKTADRYSEWSGPAPLEGSSEYRVSIFSVPPVGPIELRTCRPLPLRFSDDRAISAALVDEYRTNCSKIEAAEDLRLLHYTLDAYKRRLKTVVSVMLGIR